MHRIFHFLSLLAIFCLFGVTVGSDAARAGVPYDAGDYIPADPGTDLVLLYGQHARARGLYAEGDLIDSDASLHTDIAFLRLVHFDKIAGMTFNVQFLQPFGRVRATDGGSSSTSSGLGDTILVSTFWPLNDPAKKRYLGVTGYLFLPTGSYRADRAVNLGENRVKTVLQVAGSQALSQRVVAELGADVTLFGDNDDMRGMRLTQKPSFSVQGHLRYLFSPRSEVNVRVYHAWGLNGRIGRDAVDMNPSSVALLAGARQTVGSRFQIIVEAGRDIAVRTGYKERMRGQVRLMAAF